jgi:hypothetical protein
MDKVYLVRAKHDIELFASAVGAVAFQIDAAYQYEDDDKILRIARQIVAADDEERAVRLLRSRRSYEYEGFDIYSVQP